MAYHVFQVNMLLNVGQQQLLCTLLTSSLMQWRVNDNNDSDHTLRTRGAYMLRFVGEVGYICFGLVRRQANVRDNADLTIVQMWTELQEQLSQANGFENIAC